MTSRVRSSLVGVLVLVRAAFCFCSDVHSNACFLSFFFSDLPPQLCEAGLPTSDASLLAEKCTVLHTIRKARKAMFGADAVRARSY
jgi:hypothetical protein